MNSLREIRRKAGLSRAEVARQVGVSSVTFWRFENGKTQPKAETLQRMATVLGTTIDELLKKD